MRLNPSQPNLRNPPRSKFICRMCEFIDPEVFERIKQAASINFVGSITVKGYDAERTLFDGYARPYSFKTREWENISQITPTERAAWLGFICAINSTDNQSGSFLDSLKQLELCEQPDFSPAEYICCALIDIEPKDQYISHKVGKALGFRFVQNLNDTTTEFENEDDFPWNRFRFFMKSMVNMQTAYRDDLGSGVQSNSATLPQTESNAESYHPRSWNMPSESVIPTPTPIEKLPDNRRLLMQIISSEAEFLGELVLLFRGFFFPMRIWLHNFPKCFDKKTMTDINERGSLLTTVYAHLRRALAEATDLLFRIDSTDHVEDIVSQIVDCFLAELKQCSKEYSLFCAHIQSTTEAFAKLLDGRHFDKQKTQTVTLFKEKLNLCFDWLEPRILLPLSRLDQVIEIWSQLQHSSLGAKASEPLQELIALLNEFKARAALTDSVADKNKEKCILM